jgi:hypothetical protein
VNDVITKALATIDTTDGDDNSPNGSFEAILSAPTLDRDGDTLGQSEWKSLPARIHIDLDHEMSVAGTVGSAEPFFDSDGKMRIKGTYASTPRAQEVRTLVNEGHISTMSVAFMTDRSIKDGSPNRELLNGAFVAVPSNREAVIVSSKAFQAMQNELKAGARNSATDSQMITAIHDAAVALGAPCVEPAPSMADGSAEGANKAVRESFVIGKALSGSLEDLRNRLSDALEDLTGEDVWAWVRATFLDAGGASGTVVYDLGEETFSRTFTVHGDAVTLGTTIEAVTLVTSVAPATAETDDDSADAVEGEAEEASDEPEMRSAGTVTIDIVPRIDRDAFLAAIDTITKTSGVAGSPQSPAGSPAEAPAEPASTAAPQGPAVETAEAAADAAVKAAEQVALDKSQLSHLKARILASNARLAS